MYLAPALVGKSPPWEGVLPAEADKSNTIAPSGDAQIMPFMILLECDLSSRIPGPQNPTSSRRGRMHHKDTNTTSPPRRSTFAHEMLQWSGEATT
jgi:hypothetical protein